jgi:hypothetical protein
VKGIKGTLLIMTSRLMQLTRHGTSLGIKEERLSFMGETGRLETKILMAMILSRQETENTKKDGNKYIKTEADGREPNNLLSLAECPI